MRRQENLEQRQICWAAPIHACPATGRSPLNLESEQVSARLFNTSGSWPTGTAKDIAPNMEGRKQALLVKSYSLT